LCFFKGVFIHHSLREAHPSNSIRGTPVSYCVDAAKLHVGAATCVCAKYGRARILENEMIFLATSFQVGCRGMLIVEENKLTVIHVGYTAWVEFVYVKPSTVNHKAYRF
jgi:hypothetical protein